MIGLDTLMNIMRKWLKMDLNKAVKHQESGFRGPCSIITNYTDLHFLFFKKK